MPIYICEPKTNSLSPYYDIPRQFIDSDVFDAEMT